MIIAVGTSNPIKVKAVENVFSKLFKVIVIMKPVSINIPSQPIGLDNVIRGAIERAKKALELEEKADLGIGIEAGIIPIPYTITGYMDQQFAAIADRSGRVTIGGGPAFEYPPIVIRRVINERLEVNTIMEEITKKPKIGQKEGAIGFLSKGITNRTQITEMAVLMALIPRLNEDLFNKF
ncbi:MAG: inosine/xanthosine triphosphatase [Candidatus Verstraetearchaeota archaeon]|jgi:inosine/xanthosine triphosphatase|nr:inosine/xanthosine triphosphatase [Candidatus Verstraetearchaeota archaeon]